MTADLTMGEINEKIADLKIDLTACEDWHSKPDWLDRDTAIRADIHELERLRDLLPEQRKP